MRICEPFSVTLRGMFFEILDRAGVAAPANHVLGAAEFEQSSAGFLVAAAHGLHDTAHRNAVRAQAIRVQVHLILAGMTADGATSATPGTARR